MQTLKIGMKKMTAGNIEDRLACFLLQYRITPHTTLPQVEAQLNYYWVGDPDHIWTYSGLMSQTESQTNRRGKKTNMIIELY